MIIFNHKLLILTLIVFLVGFLLQVGYLYVFHSQKPSNIDKINTQSPDTIANNCIRGGCSDQLCIDPSESGVSTCEWRTAYACYQKAECKRQLNGKCGFTLTKELTACLQQSNTR